MVSECIVATSDGMISKIKLSDVPVSSRISTGRIMVRSQGALKSLTPCYYQHDTAGETSSSEE